jgi:hypothetical protein
LAGCGLYPIAGARWRCKECPEKVGFDLCGQCYGYQVHRQVSTGRFNQSHLPEHELEEKILSRGEVEIQQRVREIQEANPGISIEQILGRA